MGLFNNNYGVATTKRQVLINRYNSARYDMLAVAIFTAINLIMLATGSLSYFLFSASIPYEIASVARVMCGLYPEEVYEEILGGGYASLEFLDPAVFYVALAIAFVITAVYVVLFIFSKNSNREVKNVFNGISLREEVFRIYKALIVDYDDIFPLIWLLNNPALT